VRRSAIALLALLVPRPLEAQLTFDPVSRSAGGVWLRKGGDPWCALSAPPLLGSIARLTAGFAHFPSAWGLGPLTSSAAVAALPAAGGGVGFTVTRFGGRLYSETEAGIAWGSSAGAFLYGAALRLRYLSIERYGSALTPRLDLAAAVATGEWLVWGLRITDVNRGAIGRSGERLRQGVALAASFGPGGLPCFLFQAGSGDGEDFSVSAALSYDVRPFSLIAGASGSFGRLHAGAQWTAGGFNFGYGVVVHPVLGWSHSFWVAAGVDP
jgi:hypothetical protein